MIQTILFAQKWSAPDRGWMDFLLLRNTIQFLKCQQKKKIKKNQEVQMWSNVKQKM